MESERGSSSEWLEIRLTGDERIDLGRLAWLRSRPHRYLLEVEAQDEGRSPLRYNVTGLESLRSFLKSYEITSLQYENILVSLGEVVGMLRREGQDPLCLQLDERLVFSDIDGNLWFVLLPITLGEGRRAGMSPQSFLLHLARSRRISYSSADDLARSERLRKLARSDDFTLGSYEAFLVQEYGIRLDFSDTADVADAGQPPLVPAGVRAGREAAGHYVAADDAVTSVVSAGELLGQPVAGGARPAGRRTTAFRLVLLDGSEESYALGDCRTVLVGRGSGCDVRIANNLRISRLHARIERDGEGFRVTDLGSSNGTVVGGAELGEGESAHVALGETFELADVPVVVQTA